MPEKHVGSARRKRFVACLFLSACGACGACAGSDADARKPTAVLSPSLEAEGELRSLVTSWAHGARAERLAMEPALVTFRRKHPDGGPARLAEVLVSWIALDRGNLHAAEVRARKIRAAVGPGTVADIARTVEGAALRRQGRPGEAVELLLPLLSKLIDPWARALYNQEIVDSAVEAARWDRALALMRVWLREAALEERATARAHIEQSLERVPPAELLKLLDRGVTPAPAVEEEVEMRKLVTQRLAFVARAGKDAELAQHLLATAGALLGDQGDVVAQLAAGASRARVEARTVGLLLSLRNDQTRRWGADIAQGVAFGLGLPGSAAHLVSRDDHGSSERLEEALAALSADGASIVIAGSDEQEATTAAVFAEAHHIPVLLLRPPQPGALPEGKPRFCFVVGVDAGDLEAALAAALVARGASPVALLSDEPERRRPTALPLAAVRGCGEAGAPWKGVGAAGLVLSVEPDCAREAVTAGAPFKLRFASGFESASLPLPPGSLVATAGLFPFAAPAPEGALASRVSASPSPLRAWLKDHPAPPSWWAALGHDAAVLAWAGVQVLPAQGTEDPSEVEARRAQAAAALAGAQAELWTTDATGFGGARTLPRTLGVREITAAQR
jgi:hypothetical protein